MVAVVGPLHFTHSGRGREREGLRDHLTLASIFGLETEWEDEMEGRREGEPQHQCCGVRELPDMMSA